MFLVYDRELQEGSVETYHKVKGYVWDTMKDRSNGHDDELADEYRGYLEGGYENFSLKQVIEEMDLWNYDLYLLDKVRHTVSCLNCGYEQITKEIYEDENGKFTVCTKCESTFDI